MIVTAFPSFDNAVEAINQGRIVRYLRKPWNGAEMLQSLHDGSSSSKSAVRTGIRERFISEERNVVIGQLASGLVHELANIAAVLSVVEAVQDDWGKGLDLSEELSTLRGGVDKYWALVGSLRFCAGEALSAKLRLAPCDVREVMREAFELASISLRSVDWRSSRSRKALLS